MAVAVALVLGASCAPSPRPAPPNVLLVTIDTLRADHLGAFGDPRGASPGIDRLLRRSTSFEHAFAPRGQTWPSLMTLMTSLPPVEHGVRKNGQAPDSGTVALADVLGAHGYRCAAFLANAAKAGWTGFDSVTDLRDLDRPVVSRAKGWLRGNADAPFLVWVHLFSPHRPYAAPAPVTVRFDPGYTGPMEGSIDQIRDIESGRRAVTPADVHHLIARYDAEVAWADALVAELLRTLEELDLDERTVVVFAADHGEELYDRNGYFSHSASIDDNVLRVPLSFRRPGTIPAGVVLRGDAELMDVAPTIAALAGLAAPAAWEGRDLASVVTGVDRPRLDHVAFAELEDRVVSARTARWRYVHNPEGFDFPLEGGGVFPLEREALYDEAADPGERRNVADHHPDVVAAMRERVVGWMDDHGWAEASRRHAARAVPDETRRELESLGYVN